MFGKYIRKNKTAVIFAKRFIKYLLIFAILMLMIAPLYFKSYTLAKQLTIDKSSVKLQEGVDSLELQVLRAQEITSLLRQEDVFKRLFFLKGAPTSDYYVDFNILQTKLKSLSSTQDMFSNVYIMFKDNPIFVSNYISSDDYADVYDRYYHYKDMSVDEWYDLLFKADYNVKFLPAKQVFSSYYSRDYFEGITVLLNNSYYLAFEQKSIFAIDFDKKDIIHKLLYEDQIEDHFVYVADNENNILLSHNYPDGEILENINDLNEITLSSQKYIALTYSSDLLGLKTVIGIPSIAFEENVNSLLELVMFYVIAGTLILVLLLLFFSMKETLWLKKLVEVASRSTNTISATSNEYTYINNVFTEISTINEEQLGKIEALNNSIKYSVLKHLLILGVYTEREKEEVESYFGQKFDCFCVAKVSYRLDGLQQSNKSMQQNIGLEIEKSFESVLHEEMISLNFHSNETVFVLFFDPKDAVQIHMLKEQLAELVRAMNAQSQVPLTINIGLSGIRSGLSNAKSAYQQAQYALSINENEVSSGVYIFEPKPDNADRQVFDIAIVLKLYDALIAGEKNMVSQIFDDSIQRLGAGPLTEQEQLQVFFSFRQTVYNARQVIVTKQRGDEQPANLSIPDYDQASGIIKLSNALKCVSIHLCDVVANNKKSNNEKLKSDIVKYIESHYADPALSASGIAAQLFISEKYVFSFVKEQTGKSLGKFIEEVRVAQAERLLLETDLPNSKILKLCGFGSENTFYRAFSKKHVVSPTVWRENHKNLTNG